MGRGRHARLASGAAPRPGAGAASGGRVRRACTSALAAILVVAGLGLCAYPAIAERIASRGHAEVIAGYERTVDSIDDTERETMLAEARRHNAALAGLPYSGDPGSGASVTGPDMSSGLPKAPNPHAPAGSDNSSGSSGTSPPLTPYADLLNPNGDGVMGVLAIPQIDLRLPIRHGVGDDALAKGVGHMPDSALPIGGDGNHSVLAGHRGLPSAELFTRLDELARGDVFTVTVLGDTHAYRVTDIRVVAPDELGVAREPDSVSFTDTADKSGMENPAEGTGPMKGSDSAGRADGGNAAEWAGVAEETVPMNVDVPTGGTAVSVTDRRDILAAQPGRDLVTLVTCTPYGVNTHRLLVTGERAPDLERTGDPATVSRSLATIRIPTSPDAWFRSGWAAALAAVFVVVALAAAAMCRAFRVSRAFRSSRSGSHRAVTYP
ncbi:sortase [Bifidobacterium rousetti]|uniref:sortase n=1 Tax=Bifidobacterium rousetti TaxID=2045439 RepID=UPI00123B93A6|nr:sortase [Bifidobacterium rousetti]